MDGQTTETPEDQNSQAPIDPWAEAFAALEQSNQSNAQTDTGADGTEGNEAGADQQPDTTGTATEAQASQSDDGQSANADQSDSGDNGLAGGDTGEPGADPERNDNQAGETGGDMLGVSAEELAEYRDGLVEEVRDRAVADMAQEFIKRGIRHTNGKLGASINDADICKRDEDGTPRFYNPETGREFTGDNPRRQAQEWVDDYNKELAQAFNQACENYSAELMKQDQPTIAVLEFASTYDKLDPLRQQMFDEVISDYEIKDGNEIIGYSCDLNKALGVVNRQVERIQAWGKANASNSASNESSGPALDMKNSAGAVAPKQGQAPKSLEEAMLIQQNELLESMKKGN